MASHLGARKVGGAGGVSGPGGGGKKAGGGSLTSAVVTAVLRAMGVLSVVRKEGASRAKGANRWTEITIKIMERKQASKRAKKSMI